MRFWLDMGVDGFRLDAIPYLVEREGTNNENLPETHAVIKQLRAAIDAHYKNRFLLAEANQWPEDVREYFGDGDECHMAYHFPLMPRMYMAIAQEDRYPIIEIMQQTPDIPDSCQWAIFLRNHDELTLEMVTSKERDYMYTTYAADHAGAHQPRHPAPARAADGKRHGPHQADEQHAAVDAGLADHLLRRRDRHGRQRLRRRPQRRAHADAMEPGPQCRLLARRPAAPVPAADHGCGVRLRVDQRRGAVARSELAAELDQAHAGGAQDQPGLRPRRRAVPASPATARSWRTCASTATTRSCASPTCRAPRSRSSSNLSAFKGRVPVEMLGRTAFPPIGELPYLLTLPRYGFYWFRLSTDAAVPAWHQEDRARCDERPVLVLFDGWTSLFRDRVVPWRIGMAEKTRAAIRDRHAAALHRDAALVRGQGHADRARAHLRDQALWQEGEGCSWMLPLLELDGTGGARQLLHAARAGLGGARRGARAQACRPPPWPRSASRPMSA